jgi:hypothetical protein
LCARGAYFRIAGSVDPGIFPLNSVGHLLSLLHLLLPEGDLFSLTTGVFSTRTFSSVNWDANPLVLPDITLGRPPATHRVLLDHQFIPGNGQLNVLVSSTTSLGSRTSQASTDVGARHFVDERRLPVEAVARDTFELWSPSECPLSAQGMPLEDLTSPPA